MPPYTRGQLDEIRAGVFSPDPVITTFSSTPTGTTDLFTMQYDGLVAIMGDCNVDLTGASATIEVGITGNTAVLIPQTTATTLDAAERIDRTGVIATTAVPNVTPFFPVRAGDVIKLTVGTATITAGQVEWRLFFRGFGASSSNASGQPVTTIVEDTASTSTLSNVASSATSVAILAANTARKGAMITNDSTQVLYLKLGGAANSASATSYTVQLAPGAYYELPKPVYNGALNGIWASANGSARVTELT